jgi:NADH dehydrogenase
MAFETDTRPHVVIIGGGFGGLTAARKLKDANVRITIVDRTNHHLFQPLLYQVAMASLAPTDITAPIRYLVRKQENTEVLLGEVCKIDVNAKTIYIDEGSRAISYDFLIVAAGARHSYFGHPEWEQYAPGLKAIDDAREIRRRFLLAFEEAEKAETPEERTAWMTFVIVGGGPTGVELAGIMQDIASKALRRDFRHIDTNETNVILVEAGPRILGAFPEKLAERALQDLRELRVDVRTNSAVTAVDANGVSIGDQRIPTHTVIWAAGNAASPLGAMLGAPLTKSGQVIVERDLSIPNHPEVFVIGDLAHSIQRDGKPAPGVAQVAMQGGRVAARNIIATIAKQERKPFDYQNKGDLATIGRAKAIANLFGGKIQVAGFVAWFLWLFIHIMYLAGFRNRLSVLLQWGYAYFTYQRGARLIPWPGLNREGR